MRRFSVGDLARVKYVRNGRSECWHEGAVVEIIKVCISTTDFDNCIYDYVVRMWSGGKAFPVDKQLEPLKQERVLNKMTTNIKAEIDEHPRHYRYIFLLFGKVNI